MVKLNLDIVQKLAKYPYEAGIGRLLFRNLLGDEEVEILGTRVKLGPVVQYVAGTLATAYSDLQEALDQPTPDKQLAIKLVNLEVNNVYLDWFIREAKRLSEHIVQETGANLVILFDWLVWPDIYPSDYVIKLAVNTSDTEQYDQVVKCVENHRKYPVEVTDLRKAPKDQRERILGEGKLLSKE